MKQIALILIMSAYALQCFCQVDSNNGIPPILKNKAECLSEQERSAILKLLDSKKEKRSLGARTSQADIYFGNPIAQTENYNDDGFYGISNYVDLDDNYPNSILDYECGNRTYDTNSGYNHKGVDFFSWPFYWNKMERNAVKIIAAAPGTIIYKQENNDDKSCSFNQQQWNAVYIQHQDGSVAWYGHLKKSSLTEKALGETVELGEYLGVMGSSGNSTGPHLHFEVYDKDDNLIDPFAGSCNYTSNRSWWIDQELYRVPQINKLMTHGNVMQFGCYNEERVNQKVNFKPGEIAFFATYYRDQLKTLISNHRLLTPNGAEFFAWSLNSNTDYSASYFWRSIELPSDAPLGKWTFEVVFEGITYLENFYVLDENNQVFNFQNDTIFLENVTPTTTVESTFEILNNSPGGLLVESIESAGNVTANWHGLIHAGERKKVAFSYKLPAESSTLDSITVNTNYGVKQLYIAASDVCIGSINNLELSICPGDSLQFGNQYLTSAGNYGGSFPLSTGCDSIVKLNLSVKELQLEALNKNGILSTNEPNADSYLWVACDAQDVNLSDNVSSTFIPTTNGTYKVNAIINGCNYTSNCVEVEFTITSNAIKKNNSVVLAPNPISGNAVSVYFSEGFDGSCALFNYSGKLITITKFDTENRFEIPIPQEKGIYLLRFININKEVFTFRVVR